MRHRLNRSDPYSSANTRLDSENVAPVPAWVVMSPGTGGTSATIGRFIRYQQHETKLCVVDPENSVFHEYFQTGNANVKGSTFSKIEGIGRPRAEPSFIPGVVDEMRKIPDAASIATTH